MPNWIYDGTEALSGISGASPTLVPRNLASSAVNRWFRYDENVPRPAFRQITLEYIDDTDGNNKKLLEAGNIQGSCFYNAYPSSLVSYLILAVAGTIFSIQLIGKKGYVRKLFAGNDPVFTHAWFEQAFEWLIVQDGSARPLLWDGTTAMRRAVEGEVPTGSVMELIHGRLAVASADGTNQIAVGDIVYGSDATTTNDVIKFTEIEYWASGGAFGTPVYVGDIMGLQAMPFLDTGSGQNELVVLGTDGGVSIDLSRPREQWLDSQLLRISLLGGGCDSSHSLATMNGELFYRSTEGIRAYRNARAEFQQTWKQTPISTDVRRWMDFDSPELLQYSSVCSWNNMLFCTVQPRIQAPNNPFAGHHRFHLGFVVLDAAPESNTLREGAPIWHGLWTGIRPVCFVTGKVSGRNRCFAWSFDCDGRNRLYEVCQGQKHDLWDGKETKIRSSYTTGNLGVIERVANNFTPKKLAGGSIELSDVQEKVTVDVRFRPDDSPCFLDLDSFTVGCDCKTGDCGEMFTMPVYARKFLESPKKQCIPGTSLLSDFLLHTQAKIEMEGWAKVERMRLKFDRQDNAEVAQCTSDTCTPYQCCEEDYYCIASGAGPAVPVIATPSDVVSFVASATYVAVCPPGTEGAQVSITNTATSTVSFEDAFQKAYEGAKAQAEALLECCTCTPEVLFAFTSNNETTDLSAFFQTGNYPGGCVERPWRLIETVVEIEYATGYVDLNGTLIVVWVLPGYVTYFDPGTKQFVDGGTTDAFMELQLGCPDASGTLWP